MTIVSETEGHSWMTLTGSGTLIAPELPEFSQRSSAHRSSEDDSKALVEGNESAFTEGVATALAEIGRGTLRQGRTRSQGQRLFRCADRCREDSSIAREGREPTSTVFAIVTPDGTFMGASPELLVADSGRGEVCSARRHRPPHR